MKERISSGRGPAPASRARSLRIDRRGGLAGVHAGTECAIAELTQAQRKALDHLMKQKADEVRVGAVRAASAPGADRFSYRVQVVHDDGTRQVVDVREDELPDMLAKLVLPVLP